MTEDDYNIRIAKIRNKKRQLEKQINSMELIFPPIDFKLEGNKLISKIEELQIELEVDNFLLCVQEELERCGYTN